MIPLGAWIFIAVVGAILLAFGFMASMKEEPSVGAMTEKDKRTKLIYDPITKEIESEGFIELASQEILFKDDLGKDIFKLRYSEISKCRVRSSRIAMITGGSFLCYLGLFKKGDPQEYATFMFNSRAYFYAKDLCSQISVKIKGAV